MENNWKLYIKKELKMNEDYDMVEQEKLDEYEALERSK